MNLPRAASRPAGITDQIHCDANRTRTSTFGRRPSRPSLVHPVWPRTDGWGLEQILMVHENHGSWTYCPLFSSIPPLSLKLTAAAVLQSAMKSRHFDTLSNFYYLFSKTTHAATRELHCQDIEIQNNCEEGGSDQGIEKV